MGCGRFWRGVGRLWRGGVGGCGGEVRGGCGGVVWGLWRGGVGGCGGEVRGGCGGGGVGGCGGVVWGAVEGWCGGCGGVAWEAVEGKDRKPGECQKKPRNYPEQEERDSERERERDSCGQGNPLQEKELMARKQEKKTKECGRDRERTKGVITPGHGSSAMGPQIPGGGGPDGVLRLSLDFHTGTS
ncbi:hypothetical protein JZ751_018754 [Albula glossodonta]|uniref:Uncharacterized protein n=1 Tax=Albula glossodonta TaxID=121402 RepID=A0A8T2NR91_9TELE|nr:hypothetical protein JZ751_018754 [Albula glossodonta]